MTLLVEAVNKTIGQAILSDGQVLPITHWFSYEEECDPEDAISCVCGPCKDGYWYTIDLSEMDGVVQ